MTTIVTRIFLETKGVNLAAGLVGHLYLVKRRVEIDDDGTIISNDYNLTEGYHAVHAAQPSLPKDLFFAQREVLDVLSGQASAGTRHEAYFGIPGASRQYTYPHTPEQRARAYFVVSYLGDDGMRRLLALPASPQEYKEWQREYFKYEQLRGRPGVRDR